MDFNELSKLVEEATVRLRALMGRGADPYGQLSGFLKGSWDKQKVLIRKLQDDDRVEWDSRTGIWLFRGENEEDTVYRVFYDDITSKFYYEHLVHGGKEFIGGL